MSLHESEDARIIKIIKDKSSDKHVVAEIATRIDGEQRKLFLEHSEQVKFDSRSALARFGINIEAVKDFVWEGNYLVGLVDIYNFIPDYLPGPSSIAQLFEVGVPAGKYFLNDPHMYLSAQKLSDLLEKRHIMAGEGVEVKDYISHGVLRIPQQNVIFRPNSNYSEQSLRDIIHKRVPRQRLTKYQDPYEVDKLLVQKNSGIVTIATLMTNGLEVIVNDPSHLGIRHTEARMGSKHTKYQFFFEYIGNSKQDVEINSVDIILSQPRKKEFTVYVPTLLGTDPATSLKYLHSLKTVTDKFQLGRDNLRFIECIDLSDSSQRSYRKLSREDLTAQENFYMDLNSKENVALVFNQFPGEAGTESVGDVSDYLIRLSKKGILKTVYLNSAPNGTFFSDDSLHDLQRLWKSNTTIFWNNTYTDQWTVYYDGFWVKPEKLEEFVGYHKSGKLVAFYGSSSNANGDLEQIADNTLESILRFHGGRAGIITGGWGEKNSFMERISQLAKQKGLLVGAVFCNIPGQAQYADVDFEQHYDESHINPRQELMARVVEAEFYGLGGVGTRFELNQTLTNIKIGVGAQKMVGLLGESEKYLSELRENVKQGLVPQKLLNNIYVVKDGQEVYSLLCKHFKTAS
ncbi:MAG: hypothetical protein V1831_02280 [Candidatus Woesearchaeota archaeon]